MNNRAIGLLVADAAFVLDQGSKLVMLYGLDFASAPPGHAIQILPFFNLVMVWNPGISFGLFAADSPSGTTFLAIFQVLAILALIWWMWSSKSRLLTVALGLVIGGALGNLVDRVVYGRVADFFHFYAAGYNWYVFNVGDIAINLGVLGLLYDVLVKSAVPKIKTGKGSSS
jgi:signal peptidase II